MKDDKAFSMIEVLMGLMIIGSLETAEALLDPIGVGLILMPAEIGVGMGIFFLFAYKGGSRIEARLILVVVGSAVDLIPIIGMLPTKMVVFLIAVRLANKAAEKDAAEEKKQEKKRAGREGEEREEPEEEYDENEEDYEEEEEELPLAA